MKKSLLLALAIFVTHSSAWAIPWSKEPLDKRKPLPMAHTPMTQLSPAHADVHQRRSMMALPMAQRRDDQPRPIYSEVLERGKWEYREVVKKGDEIDIQEFSQLGKAGWEMCGVRQDAKGQSHFYFKRECSSWVVSQPQEPQGLDRFLPENIEKTKGKAIGIGPGMQRTKQPPMTEGVDHDVVKPQTR